MRALRSLLLISLALSLASCASYFKRKQCEQINWFEHGKQVAMRGEWLNADRTVMECRKVEAEVSETQLDLGFKNGVSVYCTEPRAELVGKSGDFYARDICEGPTITRLLQAYQKGNRDYCQKSNGYNAGVSGKKYQGVCAAELEKNFMPEYKRGRKVYLSARVTDLTFERQTLDSKISMQNSMSLRLNSHVRSLENQRQMLEDRRNFAVSSQNFTEANYLAGEVGTLDNQLSTARSEYQNSQSKVSTMESERSAIDKNLSEFKEELATLN